MKILYIAEITGKAGVYALKKCLPQFLKEKKCDFIIACADSATGGNGLGRNHAAYIRKLGVNVITTGECCFYKKDLAENIGKIPYVLRPYNLNMEAPGLGCRVYNVVSGAAVSGAAVNSAGSSLASGGVHSAAGGAKSRKIAVAVLLGQNGFGRMHANNPFSGLGSLFEKLRQETPFVIIDFHAMTTAEKQTFFAMAGGSCSAIIGSHSKVQTADERILPGGAAVITDAGRTGSAESVGGSEKESKIREYISGIPDWTKEASEKPELQGVYVELAGNGKAVSIERVKMAAPPLPDSPGAESRPEIPDEEADGGA